MTFSRTTFMSLVCLAGAITHPQIVSAQGESRQVAVSRAEAAAIRPLSQAVETQNWAAATAALPSAQAAATTPAARFVVGQLMLAVARGTSNLDMHAAAVDAMVASGGASAEILPRLLATQVVHASRVNNRSLAESSVARLLELSPTPANLQIAIDVYRTFAGPNDGAALDFGRLARAIGALVSERDYIGYAEVALSAGYPNETKAVLEEGLGRNVFRERSAAARNLLHLATSRIQEDRASLSPSRASAMAASEGGAARRTADAYYSYGQYADAALLYRLALQKGGQDVGMVNLRLGAALAMAGQRREAEGAFRAVSSGNHAKLARLWLAWLATRV